MDSERFFIIVGASFIFIILFCGDYRGCGKQRVFTWKWKWKVRNEEMEM